jgi:anti-sigma B factor antagonist
MDLNTHTLVHDDRSVVVAAGELDLATAPDLAAALSEALAHERDTLTIDAAGITFCDSSGLKVLLNAPGHRPVRLKSPSTVLRRVLELSGTTERFEIIP